MSHCGGSCLGDRFHQHLLAGGTERRQAHRRFANRVIDVKKTQQKSELTPHAFTEAPYAQIRESRSSLEI